MKLIKRKRLSHDKVKKGEIFTSKIVKVRKEGKKGQVEGDRWTIFNRKYESSNYSIYNRTLVSVCKIFD